MAEEEADLAAAYSYIAGGHISIRTDMAEEFGHETLAKPHDFVVTLALGVEIRAAFAAAHGESG